VLGMRQGMAVPHHAGDGSAAGVSDYPWQRAYHDLAAREHRLQTAISEARALHAPYHTTDEDGQPLVLCAHEAQWAAVAYPCPTMQVLGAHDASD
jgi:hypothetical protein